MSPTLSLIAQMPTRKHHQPSRVDRLLFCYEYEETVSVVFIYKTGALALIKKWRLTELRVCLNISLLVLSTVTSVRVVDQLFTQPLISLMVKMGKTTGVKFIRGLIITIFRNRIYEVDF